MPNPETGTAELPDGQVIHWSREDVTPAAAKRASPSGLRPERGPQPAVPFRPGCPSVLRAQENAPPPSPARGLEGTQNRFSHRVEPLLADAPSLCASRTAPSPSRNLVTLAPPAARADQLGPVSRSGPYPLSQGPGGS